MSVRIFQGLNIGFMLEDTLPTLSRQTFLENGDEFQMCIIWRYIQPFRIIWRALVNRFYLNQSPPHPIYHHSLSQNACNAFHRNEAYSPSLIEVISNSPDCFLCYGDAHTPSCPPWALSGLLPLKSKFSLRNCELKWVFHENVYLKWLNLSS